MDSPSYLPQSSFDHQQPIHTWEVRIQTRNKQYSFFPFNPRDKRHQDLVHIDFCVPHRAQYLQSAWKKHQDAVLSVDINLAIQKRLTFYQIRSNYNYFSRNTSSLLYSKSCEMVRGMGSSRQVSSRRRRKSQKSANLRVCKHKPGPCGTRKGRRMN